MFPKPMAALIDAFKRLPGVGPKAAYRMAVYVLGMPYEETRALARNILHARKTVKPCSNCFNFTEKDPCVICADESRDRGRICVVEDPEDIEAIERSRVHGGVYHVLGGVIAPIRGVGPDRIRIGELVERIKRGGVEEVLIATDPSVEGETTALLIARTIKPLGVKVTRPARGVPAGADIVYIDSDTLTRAINSRQEM